MPLMPGRSHSTVDGSNVGHSVDKSGNPAPAVPERRRTLSGAYRHPSLCSADSNMAAQGGLQRRVSVLDRKEARALSASHSHASTTQPRQPSLSMSKSVSGYAKER